MIELQILSLFLSSRDVYNNYYNYLDLIYLKENYNIIYKLYIIIDIYYNKYPDNDSMSFEDLESLYLINYPTTRDTQRQELDATLVSLRSVTANPEIIRELLDQHKIRSIAQEVAVLALDVSEGRSPTDELVAKVTSLGEVQKMSTEDSFVTDDLETLHNTAVKTPGLRWRQHFLNQSLGSLRKGDFGFIFARPETGKTTFLASEITFMADQADGPIVWFNNEEQGSKVMLRCYQAALGYTLPELFTDIGAASTAFHDVCGDKIKIFDEASITKERVESILRGLNPSLVIFDQIDKLSGFQSDRRDLEMGKIYRWARELAKEFAPVIGVCQSDVSGENQRYLTMANVSDDKTSKQAEADWVLGIGKTQDEGFHNVRFFNISKNKLIGDADTLPEMRHASGSLIIDAARARYIDPMRKEIR